MIESNVYIDPKIAALQPGPATTDSIAWIKLSYTVLLLGAPISDAKVLTGRQKPLTEIAFIFAEIRTREGHEGIGFGYSKRAGGPGMYAHAQEIAPTLLGEDPNDIAKLYNKLLWAGASMGRSGLTTQAIAPFDIALWDLKAKRAGLPLAKLLGAHRDSVQCYNTSGGYLSTPLEKVLENVQTSRGNGIGGIKIKVGQPDTSIDFNRVQAVREQLGEGFPLMVDANQQWDRVTAQRFCRKLEQFDLTWIEEPLDSADVEGHAALAASLDTAIATGEMLTSFNEHAQLITANACDFVQPDAPRVGGITPFLQIMSLASFKGLKLAPHFAMEIHLHLAAAYPEEPWLEHFEWLEPMFNERLELREGRMWVPNRPGLGFSLSEQALAWTQHSIEFGKRP
ncbi:MULTISPECIES: mandelate racemase/muconate lactonizing enzyme family protein [Pseudomonas]|uniref:Mandelate racemase/muconate lactonizing protein n=1 Tax=Pseudomonas putida TaxID=303 RepID=A0A2S3XD38_PSEPU|nr:MULTISPECIES: mandelate racemase/muconate lactonizing enzyme family protein [Pseudomonas]AVD83813.1 enolase [Pseudomonas sp. SWI6]AVD95017.1 enolase [Pseudomonas sp. SWI36]ELU0814743.1 mandelate racemase/muconate lactonizing enzyme family protein [Pseudomonas putida]MBH3388242.1 mandelate racemase/muconate lactonizing enzyme family protein [Pseudomonas putida]MCK2121418.1 mandelate racemase/muconate lactonizing enzyme family protein [Pseudomonas sp. PNPG3]